MCRSISGRIFSWYLPGAPIRSRKSRAGSTPVSACPPEVIRPSCSIFVEWACGVLEAHLRVGLDDEAAVPVAGLGIPPGQGDVEVLAVEGGVEDPEVLAELLHLTRQRLPDFLLGETVHLDVDVESTVAPPVRESSPSRTAPPTMSGRPQAARRASRTSRVSGVNSIRSGMSSPAGRSVRSPSAWAY
jgi:hypothetical protein